MSGDQAQQEKLRAAIQMASKGRQSMVPEKEARPRQTKSIGPRHPIRPMQGPFEESIHDASNPPTTRARDAFTKLNSKQRRQRLLDTNATNGTYNAQWRTDDIGSKFHPLTKIISQIAFGIHLLHQQLAKSDEEVVKILQKHVDEVDNFVQRGEEDLDLAIADIRERIGYLKLPLEHPDVFDVMLDDKKFRTSILEGNEKIEQVVDRTANFVKDLQVDQQKGMESTIEMGKYLDDIAESWPANDQGSLEIYRTMQANVEGWVQCMSTLQMKGNGLSVAIVQLGSILNEMAKRAGSASRREQRRADRAAHPEKYSSSKQRSSSQQRAPEKATSKYARKASKPLPDDPDLVARAVESTLPDAKLPAREKLSRSRSDDEPVRQKSHDSIARKAPSAPSTPSITFTAKLKSGTMKSGKDKRATKKPPPLVVVNTKQPEVKADPVSSSGSATTRQRITDLANVFRFNGSGSVVPSPIGSPTLATPSHILADSPYMTPLASPQLPPLAPQLGPIELESGGTPVHELDNEAQSTLIQARSKLRQNQSQEALSSKATRQQTPDPTAENAAADSAYASSPELEVTRPVTAPAVASQQYTIPRKPVKPGFLTSPSVMSVHSVAGSDGGDRESCTALPQVMSAKGVPLVKELSAPKLRKRASLSALKKLFYRGRSASAEPVGARKNVEEEKGGEVVEKRALEDVFELPG